MNTAVANIYCKEILADGFKLTESGKYAVPVDALDSVEATMDYVRQWPLVPAPEVFGLNDNADITKDLKEVAQTLTTVLITQSASGGGGGGKSAEEQLLDMAKDISNKLPQNYDIELAQKKYP